MSESVEIPRVLIADDDPVTHRIISEFFQRKDWLFDIVESGSGVLSQAQQKSYDLIVTDLLMPGIGGLSLLKELKERNPSQAIIVVSGSHPLQDAVTLFEEGVAIDFLEKPVNLQILESSVERVVHESKQGAFESKICQHLVRESSTYQLTSTELGKIRFPFSILERLYQAGCMDRNTKLRLDLACQEALANSLEHGNLELDSALREQFDEDGVDLYSKRKLERLKDPQFGSRTVTIETSYERGCLRIRLVDEGKGFSFENKKSSATPAEDVAVHGRGISIMEGVMDAVEYRNGGREMIMTKQFSGNEGE